MTLSGPVSPKKISPTECRAFQHGLFCRRCLFSCWISCFRAQNPLAADFGRALFPMQRAPRLSFEYLVLHVLILPNVPFIGTGFSLLMILKLDRQIRAVAHNGAGHILSPGGHSQKLTQPCQQEYFSLFCQWQECSR